MKKEMLKKQKLMVQMKGKERKDKGASSDGIIIAAEPAKFEIKGGNRGDADCEHKDEAGAKIASQQVPKDRAAQRPQHEARSSRHRAGVVSGL